MFDPTIYDNMKVVLEGAIYDLDLAGTLDIIKRSDRVDLSVMSRSFQLECKLRDGGDIQGAVQLTAELSDLAGELLDISPNSSKPGCSFQLQFHMIVAEPPASIEQVRNVMDAVWEGRPDIRLKISYDPESSPIQYLLTAFLDFGRKLDEEQAEDLPRLVDHFVLTLEELEQLERLGPG